uniref:Uncharacterized protein n=1 Tax=Caulerpa racemosa TaxID=76317 RepID=A0A1I9LKC9_CAURA|nr:hypothetical protein [Caulerpa racemosa]ANJ70790.1 hypothetical protein [Caulerpa racemosa]
MAYTPVQNIVNLVWIREHYKFFQGDVMIQSPIASTLVYWYKLNYPHIYEAYEKEVEFGDDWVLSEYREELQQLEWKFQQELKDTNLYLLFYQKKNYEYYSSFINEPFEKLPLLTREDFAKFQVSKDSQIMLHLMDGSIEEAKTILKNKTINRFGYELDGESLKQGICRFQKQLQQDLKKANKKMQQAQQGFQKQKAEELAEAKNIFREFMNSNSKPHLNLHSHQLEDNPLEIESPRGVPEAVTEAVTETEQGTDHQRESRIVVDNRNNLPPPPSGSSWVWFGPLLPLFIVAVAKGMNLLLNINKQKPDSIETALGNLQKIKLRALE